MSFLRALESSALSEWLSISMLGFPTLIALHSVGMAIAVGVSLMVTLRLFGMLAGIGDRQVPRLLRIGIWGFTLNLVTGLALFITRASEYIVSGMFLTKMSLVLISAIIMFWLIGRLRETLAESEIVVADSPARVMSLVATSCWFAAVVAGRLIAYLSDIYR